MTPVGILLLKVGLSLLLACALVWLAERRSVKLAGLLSSLPNVSLLVMLFIGVEQGTQFSSEASRYGVYGIAGNIAMALVVVCVLKAGRHFILASLAAVLVYLAIATIAMRFMPDGVVVALGFCLVVWILALTLLRSIAKQNIARTEQTSLQQVTIKFIVISLIIVGTTHLAPIIGSSWSGFVGTLPAVTLPVAVVLAVKYPPAVLQHFLRCAIIAWLPTGLYFVCVFYSYPATGLLKGTLISTLIAFLAALMLARLGPRLLPSLLR